MANYLQGNGMIVYIPLAVVFAYWLYNYYKHMRIRKKSFDDDYNEVLNSDKYKVKGRFEPE